MLREERVVVEGLLPPVVPVVARRAPRLHRGEERASEREGDPLPALLPLRPLPEGQLPALRAFPPLLVDCHDVVHGAMKLNPAAADPPRPASLFSCAASSRA